MENNLNLKLEQAQTTTWGGATKDIKDDQEPRKNKKDKESDERKKTKKVNQRTYIQQGE
jgi:hypothetical protein